jgi:ribonuclease P protein component
MLSRSNRFHGYGSLRRVYADGKTIRDPLLSLKFRHNDRRNTYRCAVVVSKKVHKSAVVRNRIRRRVYEAVRSQAGNITGTYDLVFTVFNEEVATMPAGQLRQLIEHHLKEAGII